VAEAAEAFRRGGTAGGRAALARLGVRVGFKSRAPLVLARWLTATVIEAARPANP
jgi:hypothetical protein